MWKQRGVEEEKRSKGSRNHLSENEGERGIWASAASAAVCAVKLCICIVCLVNLGSPETVEFS